MPRSIERKTWRKPMSRQSESAARLASFIDAVTVRPLFEELLRQRKASHDEPKPPRPALALLIERPRPLAQPALRMREMYAAA
jgi:hypothetical protein